MRKATKSDFVEVLEKLGNVVARTGDTLDFIEGTSSGELKADAKKLGAATDSLFKVLDRLGEKYGALW